MSNHNNSNNNGTNQGNNNNNNQTQNNVTVPNPTAQDLQLFLSCLHQVAVAQISQWHDSLQATFSARGVGSSSNNNRTNNNNPQQNNSTKAKTSYKSATTTKKNRKERKESSDESSSSESDSESEDLIWVDGDKEFEVPKNQLKENGKPYFGWAFCFVSSVKNKSKSVTKAYHCCMGCMVCPEENCTFKARPLWPSKKWMGTFVKLLKH